MKSALLLTIAVILLSMSYAQAQVPYLDVSIGPYDTDYFLGDNITVPFSVGIVGITGEAEIVIEPASGLSCTSCSQTHNFTTQGEVFIGEFTLSADQAGFYSQPFSITATLIPDPAIFDTKFGSSILVTAPFIDVSIGPYPPEVFVTDDFVAGISIGLAGTTGQVITEIVPAAGLSCTTCSETFDFTQVGEIRITNFTLTADLAGSYSQPFTVTSTYVPDPSIFDSKSGTASLEVLQPVCGVDVFGLDVTGDIISVNVKNTGQSAEDIQNIVTVDGNEVRTDNLLFTPGETQSIVFNHAFGTGTHSVESRADAACGDSDFETVIHVELEQFVCQNPPGIEGQNRCDFDAHEYLVCNSPDWAVLGQNDAAYCNNCAFGTCGDGILNCGETSSTCPIDTDGGGNGAPQEAFCDVRISDLDETFFVSDFVETHVIEVGVKNSGDAEEEIMLDIFLDGIFEEEITFNVSEGAERVEFFYFNHLTRGEHAVEVEAEAACGAQDSNFVIFFASDSLLEFTESRVCGVSIDEFNFLKQFNGDQTGFVEFGIENTGNTDEIINIELFLDGESLGADEVIIPRDDVFSGDFFYQADDGSHLLTLEAAADCGSQESITGSVTINPVVIPSPFPPEPPTTEDILETSVNVMPVSFDVEMYSAKVISVEIVSSQDQEFNIEVVGIPQEWLNYKSDIFVERGHKTAFIHISPREFGHFNPVVSVTALSEQEEFETVLEMFVAVPKEAEEFGSFFSFLFSFLATNMLIIIVSISVIVLIAVGFAGYRKLREDDDFLPPIREN